MSSLPTPWSCTACTFLNEKPHAFTCDMCGTVKPDNRPPPRADAPNSLDDDADEDTPSTIDLTYEDPDEDPDEDAELQCALALSLQQSSSPVRGSDTASSSANETPAATSRQSQPQAKSSGGWMGDRAQMERERLARLKRARGEDE
ncbi:hypothetical protein HK104_001461, partial [Borealophlyctis nickersoniae]